ncbi:hypothetical protein TrRE_jg7997 [Triparma retinervis]|uniref:Uncharacterized protein n=1 Tax=Triparma retinervis TaxID=2557542 RepID=A0A9W6ZV67_9STRA|nr:hypothetical protein TrRE_jg7997 [Triparma retinervis]
MTTKHLANHFVSPPDLPSSREYAKRNGSTSTNAISEVARLSSSQENSKRRESTSVNAAPKVEDLPSSQENSKRQTNSANTVAEVAALTTPPEPSFGLIRLEKVEGGARAWISALAALCIILGVWAGVELLSHAAGEGKRGWEREFWVGAAGDRF